VDNGVSTIGTGQGQAPPPKYNFNQCQDQSNCCNGLENICDVPANEILYAGVHNAQSTVQDGFFIVPNHQYDMIAALDYGYRVLNVDMAVCADGELALVHGACKLGTIDPTTFFTRVKEWLDNNPSEVVLIPIQIDNSAGGGEVVDLGRIYNLLNRIDGFTNRMYMRQGVGGVLRPWPTLRDLITSDKRILVFHYNGEFCSTSKCPPGLDDWFNYAAETKFEFSTEEEFQDKAEACAITRGRPNAPFYALNVFTMIPSKVLARELLNTKDFLEEHIKACSEVNGGRHVSAVFVDFFSEGDLPQVVQLHNSKLGASTRKRSLRSIA